MRLIVATFVLMTALWSTHAMDSSDDNEDPKDLYILAPKINLTDATLTRAQENHRIIFDALLPAGNQIIVQQHLSDKKAQEYSGEHLFTSPKGLQLSDDLSSAYAHELFDECSDLHTQQAKKTVLLQTTH